MDAPIPTRGMFSRNDVGKEANIFIKKKYPKGHKTKKSKDGYDIKIKSARKKWEPKNQNKDEKKGE